MKEIIIKKISMENFKKFHAKTIEFGDRVTSIFGQNYRGKSSVADAFSWVMFNKSSTGNVEGSQFRPRRYDENGVNVDHVDVMVEMILLVNGEEVKIKKVQKQEWVRHRGDDYDSYMGDKTEYEWNDVPVTPTNHKKKVAEIISEDVFRLISNPAAFPSMPAKKQREFLLNYVANITDDDVFATSPEFAPIRDAMGKGTMEELLAKTKKEISKYKERQVEIPIRIDQESKRIQDVDFSAKERELAKLQEDLADNEARMEDAGKAYDRLNELKRERGRLFSKAVERERAIHAENEMNQHMASSNYRVASMEFDEIVNQLKRLESALQIKQTTIKMKEKELGDLREDYINELQREMEAYALVCPTCGRDLPEDQAEEVREKFEKEKAHSLSLINHKGKALSSEIHGLREDVAAYEKEIENVKQTMADVMERRDSLKAALDNSKAKEADVKEDKEWLDIMAKIKELDAELENIDTSDSDAMKAQLKEERADIQKAMDEVKMDLALKRVIEKSKDIVEQLKKEMVDVVQSLADCEKLENSIEKFNKAKMDLLSEKINDKFEVVQWKLFEKQKNQRYAECCVCMVNGSCYGENTTSATERMMAGMDIIQTLQRIYNVEAPIFLDDADLYNPWNIPPMDSQLIKLCVSTDEDLRVEVE